MLFKVFNSVKQAPKREVSMMVVQFLYALRISDS